MAENGLTLEKQIVERLTVVEQAIKHTATREDMILLTNEVKFINKGIFEDRQKSHIMINENTVGIEDLRIRLNRNAGRAVMKNIGVVVTILLALGGGLVGYGELKVRASETEKKTVENKADLKDVSKRIQSIEKYGIEQSYHMKDLNKSVQNIAGVLEKLNEKIDED